MPLVSGRITKRNASILAIVSIVACNLSPFTVSWAYKICLKGGIVTTSLSRGSARFLNVVLGGSPALFPVPHHGYTLLNIIGYCLFLHMAAISIEIDAVKIFPDQIGLLYFFHFPVYWLL
jgi:hypothetical protein